jgi:serine/threonine-protein kinase RsbW
MAYTVDPSKGAPCLDFPSEIRHIASLESLVQRIFMQHGIAEQLFANVLVALTEASNNAVLHGNAGDPQKRVRISYFLSDQNLYFRVADEGMGFNPETLPDPTDPENIDKPNGRGVFLMRRLTDELRFEGSGNAVLMGFKL